MPYYGPTTQFQHLSNFMKKQGRTKGDFKGLFGFNPLEGIEYKMIQAASRMLAENDVKFRSETIGDYTIHFNAVNGNTANLIFVNEKTKEQIIVDYIYCTEKFPSIQIITGKNNHQYAKKLSMDSGEFMADVIPLTVIFLSNALWEVYEVKHEND